MNAPHAAPKSVPVFPRGTTIRSMNIQLTRQLGATDYHRRLLVLYGRSDIPRDHFWGQGATRVAKALHGPDADVQGFIRNYTAHGISVKFGIGSPADDRLNKFFRGDSLLGGDLYRDLFFSPEPQRGSSRWCPTCCLEDIEQVGVAHWKFFHQMTTLSHCILHGVNLVSACPECADGGRCAAKQELPPRPCDACAARRPSFLGSSDSYRRLLTNCHLIFVNKSWIPANVGEFLFHEARWRLTDATKRGFLERVRGTEIESSVLRMNRGMSHCRMLRYLMCLDDLQSSDPSALQRVDLKW